MLRPGGARVSFMASRKTAERRRRRRRRRGPPSTMLLARRHVYGIYICCGSAAPTLYNYSI
eukprot:8160264-Pyramimonas_sp.AAC.1